jgi:hypothetical protein
VLHLLNRDLRQIGIAYDFLIATLQIGRWHRNYFFHLVVRPILISSTRIAILNFQSLIVAVGATIKKRNPNRIALLIVICFQAGTNESYVAFSLQIISTSSSATFLTAS